jgi:hypothetical protein
MRDEASPRRLQALAIRAGRGARPRPAPVGNCCGRSAGGVNGTNHELATSVAAVMESRRGQPFAGVAQKPVVTDEDHGRYSCDFLAVSSSSLATSCNGSFRYRACESMDWIAAVCWGPRSGLEMESVSVS